MPAFLMWLITDECGQRETKKAPGKGLLHAVPLSSLHRVPAPSCYQHHSWEPGLAGLVSSRVVGVTLSSVVNCWAPLCRMQSRSFSFPLDMQPILQMRTQCIISRSSSQNVTRQDKSSWMKYDLWKLQILTPCKILDCYGPFVHHWFVHDFSLLTASFVYFTRSTCKNANWLHGVAICAKLHGNLLFLTWSQPELQFRLQHPLACHPVGAWDAGNISPRRHCETAGKIRHSSPLDCHSGLKTAMREI